MTRENAVKGLLEVADWHYGKYEQTHEEDYLNDGDFLTAVANLLKAQEPVDAVPVVHGQWIEIEDSYGDCHYQCTECGEEWNLDAGTPEENNMNYCPNCGAKMDGERRDES